MMMEIPKPSKQVEIMGMDLSDYGTHLQNERLDRTISLRRKNMNNSSFYITPKTSQSVNSLSSFHHSNSIESLKHSRFNQSQSETESTFSSDNIVSILTNFQSKITTNPNCQDEQLIKIFTVLLATDESIAEGQAEGAIDHYLLYEIADDLNIAGLLIDIYSTLLDYALDTQVPSKEVTAVICLVMQVLSMMFRLGDEDIKTKCGDEMTTSFYTALTSHPAECISTFSPLSDEHKFIIRSIFSLISLFTEKSSYLRNCMTCLGVQPSLNDLLINLMRNFVEQNGSVAIDEITYEIITLMCDSLISIFSDPIEDLDENTVLNNFIEVIELGIFLDGNFVESAQAILIDCFSNGKHSIPFILKKTAIDCLVNLTNHKPSESVFLSQKGLLALLFKILSFSIDFFCEQIAGTTSENLNEASLATLSDSPYLCNWSLLVSSILRLLENTVNSQLSADISLVENGFLQKLFFFIQLNGACSSSPNSDPKVSICQSLAADSFCILSNMIRLIPETIIPEISHDFIKFAVMSSISSPATIKREITFFLATCILFFSNERILETISISKDGSSVLLEEVSEMLSCGRHDIVSRCIGSLIALVRVLSSGDPHHLESFLSAMEELGIMKSLEDIMDSGNTVSSKPAAVLYQQLRCLFAQSE